MLFRWCRRFLHKRSRYVPTDIWTAAREARLRRVSYSEGKKWLTIQK